MNLSDNCNQCLNSILEKPLILAVDYHEDNLLLVSHVLLSFGCTFITTTNVEQTFSLARDHLPNLILLEVFLQNGMKLVHRLKEDKVTSKIPIIAVTALASPKERELILDAGCDDYLSKPYLLKDLENIIRRNLHSQPLPASTV